MLTHGSLFSGIGGFDEGFHRAGFRCLWQVEKEPFCIAVLKTHFPNVERYYDVLKCGYDRIHKLRAVDVVTAGFPCQDLSVAGKRAGLEGTRSGLFWEVVRIVGELRPTWFVLENVPGLFSSDSGRDFGIVLRSLDELGYGVAWRVLNSQFFGVAQRRRRVFIVGCLGKPCPAEVLFESEGSGGDSQESGEAWPGVAAPLTSGVGVTSNAPGRRREDDYNLTLDHFGGELAATLPGCRRIWTDGNADNVIATALSASTGHHGHSSPRGDGSDNLVFHHADEQQHGLQGVRGESSSTSDGSGAESRESGRGCDCDIVSQAISSKWAKGSSGPAGDEHHNLTVVIQDARGQRDKRQNGIGIQEGGPSYTLDGTSQHAVGTYAQHKERSSQQFDSEREMDGAMGGDDHEREAIDSDRMRDFAGLPQGLDSARYRALGNAVTVQVAEWIGRRIVEASKDLSVERPCIKGMFSKQQN